MDSLLEKYYAFWFDTNDLYDTWAKRRGLTVNELFTLYMIDAEKGQCTPKTICDQLFLPKQTVSSILNAFEKKEYVVKKIMDRDRRNKIIVFTESGETYARAILTELHQMERQIMDAMTEEERHAMEMGTAALLKNLKTIMEEE